MNTHPGLKYNRKIGRDRDFGIKSRQSPAGDRFEFHIGSGSSTSIPPALSCACTSHKAYALLVLER
jgi:hypothetical protein